MFQDCQTLFKKHIRNTKISHKATGQKALYAQKVAEGKGDKCINLILTRFLL